jgi:outer membrane lipoprotein-sorting protein
MRKDWLKFVALFLPVLTGCLSHTRKLQQPILAGPVMSADVPELLSAINKRYQAVDSLTATADFTPSVGGAHRGQQTDYTSFRGYILFRKPKMLRVVVLVPVLRTVAVNLASNGTTFTMLIPPKGRAIVGKNSVTKRAANPVENLRPNLFTDTLLIPSISPNQIVSVIHESTTTLDRKTKRLIEQPEYDLTVLDLSPSGPETVARVAKPLRVIRFSRLNLLPTEQDIYNANGDLETQVTYSSYQDFSGTQFPATIVINRPLDEFRLTLNIEKLVLNQTLADDQFEIEIPKGVHVEKVE